MLQFECRLSDHGGKDHVFWKFRAADLAAGLSQGWDILELCEGSADMSIYCGDVCVFTTIARSA